MTSDDARPPGHRAELLAEIVDVLPERGREVMNALYWECVSLGVVARRLGLSKRQVGRIRDRALRRLRSGIEDMEDLLCPE